MNGSHTRSLSRLVIKYDIANSQHSIDMGKGKPKPPPKPAPVATPEVADSQELERSAVREQLRKKKRQQTVYGGGMGGGKQTLG